MTKVKIFWDVKIREVEKEINEFLDMAPDVKIIDIKFQNSMTDYNVLNTALVIYETN